MELKNLNPQMQTDPAKAGPLMRGVIWHNKILALS